MIRIIIIAIFISTTSIYAQVSFNGLFESGNIAKVTQDDSVSYTVTTKQDIGGRWFYFRMAGVKNRFVRVTIANSDVKRAMYSYDDINFMRFSIFESPHENVFEKTYAQDTVYVAYYTPYTFSYLQKRIQKWEQSPFVSVDTIGYTDHNLPVEEIILTDPAVPDSNKYQVWIHARTHPGETPSSFHFDGIVQELLKNDDVIEYYRKNIIFHLIPFTNPEGVYYGRSRTNYFGVDVESNWNETEAQTSQEVKILKKRMLEVNNKKVLSVFLNLHSQASPYCTFWIHTPASTNSRYYRKEYQFANLNTSDNPYFTQQDYSESSLKPYFPEGWLWDNFGSKVMALTYETPYDHYSNGTWVTNENLYEIGARTVFAIGEFLNLSHPEHLMLDNKDAVVSGNWQADTTGLQFYGANFLAIPGGNGNNSVTYTTQALKAGKYDIYGWWTADPANAYNTNFNINTVDTSINLEKTERTNGGQWNYLTDVELKSEEQISIKVNDKANGRVVADAFRVIYSGSIESVKELPAPQDFVLYQNYPNPFNPTTTIRFKLKNTTHVQLSVFNELGQLVAVLIDNVLSQGQHQVIFNASNFGGLSSGVYYYYLKTNKFAEAKGMILLK